jgi:hypothetical protein
MSDNFQNLSQPIDICSPFVYHALEVLAGSGAGEPLLTGFENKAVSDLGKPEKACNQCV